MQKISIIIISIITLIFIFNIKLNNNTYDIINYATRSFYHADVGHLIANMFSLLSLSQIESKLGTFKYVELIFLLWIISSLLLLLIQKFITKKVYTIGFSAVIYGMIVVYYVLFGIRSTQAATYLIISILPQLYIQGISFEGHLSGIIAGLICVKVLSLDKF